MTTPAAASSDALRAARLYYDEPFLQTFETEVVAHAAVGEQRAVVLRRSAFYPESGGQLADLGALTAGKREYRVVDVQVVGDQVLHVLEDGALPDIATSVRGEIQWDRRRANMSIHTGQHMLSRAFADRGSETVSSRLGDHVCTIDLDKTLSERAIADAENTVNALVDQDVTVRAYFPEAKELESMNLRREIKVAGPVRVVVVDGFDVTPCGGTHCTRTAQIGFVKVLEVQGYKGGSRVIFEAGARARSLLAAESKTLRELARGLTCGVNDVSGIFQKQKTQIAEMKTELGKLRASFAEARAAELVNATSPVIATLPVPVDLLRAIAKQVATGDRVALLAAPVEQGLHIITLRGKESDFDCGGFLKRAAAACGGRGGGRPTNAEGRFPAIDWDAVARDTLSAPE